MRNQLEDVLEQFRGKTADNIAAMIQRRHIKGRLGTTSQCPMAILLDNIGTGRYVIGRKYIVRRSGPNTALQKASTPPQVAVFIRKFDLGKYPHLIAPPPRCIGPQKPHTKKKNQSGPSGPSGPRGKIKVHLARLVGRFDKTVAQPA